MSVRRGDVSSMMLGLTPWREHELRCAQGFISQMIRHCEKAGVIDLRQLERAERDLALLPEHPGNDDLRERIERLVSRAPSPDKERGQGFPWP